MMSSIKQMMTFAEATKENLSEIRVETEEVRVLIAEIGQGVQVCSEEMSEMRGITERLNAGADLSVGLIQGLCNVAASVLRRRSETPEVPSFLETMAGARACDTLTLVGEATAVALGDDIP